MFCIVGNSTGRPINCMEIKLNFVLGLCCSQGLLLCGHSCLSHTKKVFVKLIFEPQALSLVTFSTIPSSRSIYSSWSLCSDFLVMYDPKPLR